MLQVGFTVDYLIEQTLAREAKGAGCS